MQILIFIGPILLGALLSLIIRPKAKIVYNLAVGYMLLALLLSINLWVLYFVRAQNATLTNILRSKSVNKPHINAHALLF
jgi:hypothetical protein